MAANEWEAYVADLSPRIYRFLRAIEWLAEREAGLSAPSVGPLAIDQLGEAALVGILRRSSRMGPRRIPSLWRLRVLANVALSRGEVEAVAAARALRSSLGVPPESLAAIFAVPTELLEARLREVDDRSLGLAPACATGGSWVDRLAHGELRGTSRARASRHVQTCSTCRPRHDRLRARRLELLEALDTSLLPEGLHRAWSSAAEAEIGAYEAARRKRFARAIRLRPRGTGRPSRWLLVGVACVAVALLVFWVRMLR